MYQLPIPEEQVFAFLESRKNQLDAVVITGGEPTLQSDLIEFIKKVKAMGFLVKLDTNGSNPKVLEQIINQKLVDFIAMDIKAPFDKYNLVCCVPINIENIKTSIELIKNSGIDFLFRTTYDKSKLFDKDIQTMTDFLKVDTHYKVQKCNPVVLH
jgi:pyruvate formate lyase activating enzyme